MSDFKTFMSLKDIESVSEITAILKKSNLPFKIQDTSKDFDVTFSNDSSKNSFLIMLHENDFNQASTLLEDKLEFNISDINESHPLFLFTIEELKEVVKNYEEWHPLDIKLAKFLLEKQNIIVSDDEIKEIQLQNKIKAYQPEKSDSLTLIMGYTFCLAGGFAGIGIALFLLLGTKKSSNGAKRYIFSKSDRRHGVFMMIAGIISLTFFIFKYL